MCGAVKESQCTHCDHLPVCSFKEQFLKAQEAVDNISVGTGDHGIKRLRDFDWIKPVELECIHFSKKLTKREGHPSISGI